MLACARLGAPHTVVFAGFSAEALSGRINDAQAKLVITADGSYRRGKAMPLKPAVDEAVGRLTDDRARPRRPPPRRRRGHRDHRGPRRLVARHRRAPGRELPARAARLGAHALPALHVGHDRQAQGDHAHDGRLPRRHVVHPPDDLRPQARRRVLVRGRHRLGDRPQLHRLRAARERDDRDPLRGLARHAGLGPLVADHRGLQGLDPVLRADRDPGVHEAGRRPSGEARPVVAPRPRIGRRADQPRGVALVQRAHRRRQGPDRRHVVADRDRDDPHHAAARRDDDEAGLRDLPVPRHRGRRRRRRGRERAARPGRLPRPEAAVAVDAPRHLRRPGALQADVLEPVPRDVLRRRRGEARRATATSGCSAGSTT